MRAKISSPQDNVVQATAQTIDSSVRLSEPSHVLLGLNPESVQEYIQDNGDLIIRLDNNETITLENFYNSGGVQQSQLFLVNPNNEEQLMLVDLSSGAGDELVATYIPQEQFGAFDPAASIVSDSEAGSFGSTALIAGGVIAAGGLAAAAIDSGSSSGGSSNSDTPSDSDNPDTPDDADNGNDDGANDGSGDTDDDATAPPADSTITFDDASNSNIAAENVDAVSLSGFVEEGFSITAFFIRSSIGEVMDVDMDDIDIDDNGNLTVVPQDLTEFAGSDLTAVMRLAVDDGDSFRITDTAFLAAPNDNDPPDEGLEASISFDTESGFINAEQSDAVTLSGQANSELISLTLIDSQGNPFEIDTSDIVFNDQGEFSVTPQNVQGLAEGEISAVLVIEDSAGQVTRATASTVLDTIAPGTPELSPTDGTLITGTAEPETAVELRDAQGQIIGSVTANQKGEWSLIPETPLEDESSIEATAIDGAGNESDPGTIVVDAGFIDNTPPQAPTIETASDNMEPSGERVDGEATNDTTPTLNGFALAGSTVTVYMDGTEIGSQQVDDQGRWSLDLDPLDEGVATFTAVATDDNGNSSSASNDFSLTIDTVPPDAPLISPTDGEIINGTAEPGSDITLSDGQGNTIGKTLTSPEGSWSFAPNDQLEDGTVINAVAIDAAGNSSEPSTLEVDQSLDIDEPPVTPEIVAIVDGEDPTGIRGDGEPTNDDSPTIRGFAEANNLVRVMVDGEMFGETWADETGVVSFSPEQSFAPGFFALRLVSIDAYGTSSLPSNTFTLNIDTTPPDAPVVEPGNGEVIEGTAEPASTVTITDANGNQIGQSAITDDDGSWSITPDTPLDDGDSISVVAIDQAGNISDSTSVVIDAAAPVVTIDPLVTNDASSGITGTIDDSDAEVTVTVDGNDYDAVVDGNTWSLQGNEPTLTEGETLVTVTATDPAGNTSDPVTRIITVDLTAPDTPVVNPSNGEIIDGTAEPGSTVTVTDDDGNQIGEPVTTGDDGNWSVTPGTPLDDGESIGVVATDPAGNVSEPTTVVIDAVAPDAPVVEPSNGEIIDGTAEPGSTVTVTDDDGNQIGEPVTTGEDGSWSVIPGTPLDDGDNLNAVATDPAGNDSNPTTIVIDAMAPVVTIEPLLTNDTSPEITGTVDDPNAQVTVIVDGDNYDAVVDGNTWSLQDDRVVLDEGPATVVVTATDSAGNTSAPVTEIITVDLSAPATPVVEPSNGEIIDGTAEPGSTVTVTDDDGNQVGEPVTAGDDGSWSVIPGTPLDDGESIGVVATDPAGNASESTTVVIDAVAPDAPVVEPSNGETINGTAEPGSTVTVTDDDGNQVGELVTVDGDGNWSVTPGAPLDDGDSIGVVATDPAGNVSDPATTVIDAVAPVVTIEPLLTDDISPEITGTIDDPDAQVTVTVDGNDYDATVDGNTWTLQNNDITLTEGDTPVTATAIDPAGNASESVTQTITVDLTAPQTPVVEPSNGDTLDGTAEPGSSVTVTDDDGNQIGEPVIADDNGDWSVTPGTPLDDGDSINVVATDPAGNVSDPDTVVIGTIAPTVTVDPVITNMVSPEITGTVDDPDAQVTVTVNGDSYEATVDGNTWSLQDDAIVLEEGPTTIAVTATDPAGNTSDPVNQIITVDLTAPDAPVVNPSNGETIDGTAESGSTVTVTDDDGNQVGEPVTVDEDGNWSVTPGAPLDDGDSINAVATDPAGNVSEPATVVIDAVVPVVTIDPLVTNNVSPEITGTVDDPDAQVTVTVEGDSYNATNNGDGTWSLSDGPVLDEGATSIVVTAIDPADNISDPVTGIINIDLTAPDTPEVNSSNGETIDGTAESGSTVTVTDDDGNQVGEPVTVDEDGNWSVTPDTPLGDNDSIDVVATDPAGNVSEPTTVVIDAVSPVVTIEPLLTNDASPEISGTVNDPDAQVTVTVDGDTYDAINNGDGTWSLQNDDITLPEGDTTVTATAIDLSGNTSDPVTQTITIDLTTPDAPVVEPSNGETIDGTAEPGSTVTVTDDDGNQVGEPVTVDEDGNWSITPDTPLDNGDNVDVVATDPAGNVSDPASIVIDAVAPVVTVNPLVTSDISPEITGTVDDPDAQVTVTVEGDSYNATNNGDGTWSLQNDDITLPEGDTTVTATAIDLAGNTSDPVTQAITIDLTAPAAPVVEPSNGETIDGTAESGSTVTVTDDDGNQVGEPVTVDEDGNWSITPDTPLDNGDNIDVVATDPAGNVSEPTTVVIDAAAPIVTIDPLLTNDSSPEITGTVDDPDARVTVTVEGDSFEATVNEDSTWTLQNDELVLNEGATSIVVTATDPAGNSSDPVTEIIEVDLTAPEVAIDPQLINDTSPVITGTVDDPDAQVTVTVDGENYDATNNGDGTWSLDNDAITLPEGDTPVTATATDPAGNTSEPVTEAIVVDQTAPVVTVDSSLSSDPSTEITGTVDDPDAQVTVIVGTDNYDATNNGDGTWSLSGDFTLDEGTTTVTAIATDPAGNTSQPASGDITIDVTAPDDNDGLNTITFDDGENGFINANEADSITLSGQIESGASVIEMVINDVANNSLTVATSDIRVDAETGSVSVDPQDVSGLVDGQLTATLTITDGAGNTGSISSTTLLDTVAPEAPSINPSDGDILTGTAEPGATIQLSDGSGEIIGSTIAGDEGTWSFTPDEPLPDDSEVMGTATDAAGNQSIPESIIIEAGEALLPPVITLPGADDGFINADESLQGTQVLAELPEGTQAGDVLVVTFGSGDDASTRYEVTERDLDVGRALFEVDTNIADGDYIATAVLERGNSTSDPSDGVEFTLDTTPPGLPEIALNSATGVLSIAGQPNTQALVAIGLAGQEVRLSVPVDGDGQASVNLLADVDLDLSLTDLAQLGISVASEDQAGNTSDYVTLGLNPPDLDSPVTAQNVLISDDGTTLSGSAEAGATIEVDINEDGRANYTGQVNDDGTFSIDIDPALVDGELISVRVTDAGGNTGDPTVALSPRVEQPGGFSPTIAVNDIEDGFINSTAADNGIQTRVRLPSDASEGDTLELRLSNAAGVVSTTSQVVSATMLAVGYASVALGSESSSIPQGQATIDAVIERGDGSISTSQGVDFVIDTIAPSTPVLDLVGDTLFITGDPGTEIDVDLQLSGITTRTSLTTDDNGLAQIDVLEGLSLDLSPAELLRAGVSVTGQDEAGNVSDIAQLNLGLGLLDDSGVVTLGGFGVTDVSLGSLLPLQGPTLEIGGQTDPNATLSLTVGLLGGEATLSTQADENGNFGINLLSADTIGQLGTSVTDLVSSLLSDPNLLSGISITAQATDPEGNSSTEYGISLSGSGVSLAIGSVTVSGTDGDDMIQSTEQPETLEAGAGADIILDVSEGDSVYAGNGNDLIAMTSNDVALIDGGEGFDTLMLDGGGIELTPGGGGPSLSNLQSLLMSNPTDSINGNTAVLTEQDVIDMTDEDDQLQVSGSSNDTLNIQGAELTASVENEGVAYDRYSFGEAIVDVEQDTVEVVI